MAATHCSTCGIDSTGNNMPESITTGISSTIAERSNATSCVWAILEISSPNERASRM